MYQKTINQKEWHIATKRLKSPTHLEVDGLVVELEADLATTHLHPVTSLLLHFT
jgi:hypothetical protein